MKKIVSIFLAAILAFSFGLTSFAAVTATEANAARDEAKATFDKLVNTMFDVDGSNSITAADARATLLYSAGLAQKGINTSKMDTDGDKKVTAIDARVILRLSAGLDSINTYLSDAEKLDYFNAILNTAKPNNYYLYKNGVDYTADIKYSDPNGVIKDLNDGFKTLSNISSAISSSDKIDFGEALTSGKGERVYSGNVNLGNNTARTRNRMPIIYNSAGIDDYVSSYLTIDDITKVEYKTNQTYTFTRYGTTDDHLIDKSKVLYTSNPVTGLDSLTVYLKSDNDITGAHTSKAFTVYDQKTLDAEVNSFADSFKKVSKELETLAKDFGEVRFNVTPSAGAVKYYEAYITVYFNPDSGEMVSVYYSMYTDYTMRLYMDIYIKMLSGFLASVDTKGNIDITNKTQSTQEYYFFENNPSHVNWKN